MSQAAYRIDDRLVDRAAFYAVACDPARSVAVEACAGAGKTWMLVSRILRALLDGTAPQDILAITFTKKAAGEMRLRLQDWLREFATLDEARLTQELVWRGMAPAEASRRVGDLKGLHAQLLATGRPVQIRTFHSWFAALLRGAPLSVLDELDLPPDHELLEDDTEAVALVWPRFYAAVVADPSLHRDFMDSVARYGRHQTLKGLGNALGKRVEFA
ncbi:MAG: UvrD-helicase domain-containing protein, partial [Hydrogenophaga sp.]|nr:UvrD-helicase domain-containing protein [Hydrogenophaga sp.]